MSRSPTNRQFELGFNNRRPIERGQVLADQAKDAPVVTNVALAL